MMPQFVNQSSPDQQKSVQHFLEVIIRNAERDADHVIAYLSKRGIKPNRKPSKGAGLDATTPTGPAAEFLLNLGAAFRLRRWERAGLTGSLPSDLPSAPDALQAAGECSLPIGATRVAARDIPLTVFRTQLEEFALDGAADLGADVVRAASPGSGLLDAFAAFLLAVCRNAPAIGKEETEHDGTNEKSR